MFINTMRIIPSSSSGTIVAATDLLAVQSLAWLATLPLLPFTMPAKGKYVIGKYAAGIVKLHGLRGRRCYRLRKMGVLEYLVFSPSTGLFFSNGYGDTSFKMVLCGITSSVLFTVIG
nr:hypothetical protein [Tanacetum cinerariifolium]